MQHGCHYRCARSTVAPIGLAALKAARLAADLMRLLPPSNTGCARGIAACRKRPDRPLDPVEKTSTMSGEICSDETMPSSLATASARTK
jgi:hypothetical protein